ncbi:AraC family transcriptional regulator [Chitinophaga silvatica]|uniref:AraC family transcriptional regulator n=1 Tax=Chitinophaga silvatica TaxID=2282649 RepID=A0A3E1YBQ8_9BACT|nr:AraC family transcriptional regulator [Chitinophaga silvatica]RFS23244.1 AraC family transcriptional regulator [Chitinophaga silvatica]
MPVEILAHLIHNHATSAVRRFAPATELKKVIDCYCWYTARSVHKVWAALDGTPGIVLVLSDTGFRLIADKNKRIEQGFLCRGVLENVYLELTGDRIELLVIKFHADAADYLPELSDSATISRLPVQYGALLDQLKKGRSINDRIAILNSFYSNHCPALITGNAVLKIAVDMVKECNGLISVKDLCQRLKVNYKWLERNFRWYMNVSPKAYIDNFRFIGAWAIMQKQDRSLTHIALEAGYYDQAHFIKAFKKYTGSIPSARK